MKTQPDRSALRKKAEYFLRKNQDDVTQTPPEDILSLVEELRIHQIELELQNEELQRAQLEISDLRDKFEDLYDFVPVGYFVIDEKKHIQEVNLTACMMLGRDRSRLKLGYFNNLIDSSYQEKFAAFCRNTFSSKLKQSCEVKLLKADNSTFYAQLESIAISDTMEESAAMRIAIVDINEQKKAEHLLKASLEEKEVLIQEIHHRVKNNMQVIISLLNLQANNTTNIQLKEALKESQNRVYSMSAIHEILHNSESLSKISLKSYLSKIAWEIFHSSYLKPEKVQMSILCDDLYISIKSAGTLGLVINELLSNSLKYAFPNDRKGKIEIILKKLEDSLLLNVMDDGIGLSEDFDWKNSGTLGLNLVRTLVENQLDGSIDIIRENGTKFTIKFNIEHDQG